MLSALENVFIQFAIPLLPEADRRQAYSNQQPPDDHIGSDPQPVAKPQSKSQNPRSDNDGRRNPH